MNQFKVNTKLQFFYWVMVMVVAIALFADKYAAAAFFGFLLIVVQLSEIATYLQHLLAMKIAGSESIVTDAEQKCG